MHMSLPGRLSRVNPSLVNKILVCCMGLLLGAVSSLSNSDDVLGWAVLFSGAVLMFVLARMELAVTGPLFAGFCLRLCLALFHYYVAPLPDSQADAIVFEYTGWQWSQYGLAWLVQNVSTGAFLYSWVIALLYALTDRSPLMIQGLNVVLGSLVILGVFRIAKLLWGNSVIAKKAAWVTALFPTLALYSALTMREVAVVFPLVLGTLHLVRWLEQDRFRDFALSVIGFVLSLAFHTGIIAAVAALVVIVLLRWTSAFRSGRVKQLAYYSSALAMTGFAVFLVLITGWGLTKLGSVEEFGLDRIQQQQVVASRSRAAYLDNLTPTNVVDLLWQTPIRVAAFLFTPFPWTVTNLIDVLGLFDALLYLVLIRNLVRVIPRYKGNWPIVGAIILVGALVLVFAMGTSNYGTAIRHRAKMAPIFIALAAGAGTSVAAGQKTIQ